VFLIIKTNYLQPGSTHDLRQVEGIIANGVKDQVLELVHGDEQILTQRSHDGRTEGTESPK
jgi:hypothetical protein